MHSNPGGICYVCVRKGEVKYKFTPELLDELHLAYSARNRPELTAAIDRLQRKTGWARATFSSEARRHGWALVRRTRWSPEELEYLGERVGSMPVATLARKLGRSVDSVRCKAWQLVGYSRVQEGYTIADLKRVFGVTYPTVKRWMDHGMLGKVHEGLGAGLRVADRNVYRFLRHHAHEYDLRRVDQTWYKSVVFGHLAERALYL